MNGQQEHNNGYAQGPGQGQPQGQGQVPPGPAFQGTPAYPGTPTAQGAPAYPGTPAYQPAPVAAKRPKQVDSSFAMLMVVLVLTVLSVPVGIAQLNSDESRAAIESQAGASAVDAAIAGGIILVSVMAIIGFAVTLVSAIFIRKGHNWARIMLTVYTGLTVLSLLAQFNFLGWWGILLLVLATVPLYLAPSPEYFKMMKQSRQNQKAVRPF